MSVAISLQQEGIPFDIYERDCRLEDRREGFGLTLTCGKNGALDKLGVLEDCLSADCPSFCHWIFTPKGKILGYYGRALTDGVSRKNLNRSGNIRVPREALRRILMNKLKTEIKWNKKFVGCSFKKENLEEGLYVHFADGTVTRTDVLVGADGLHSRVRSVRDSNLFKNLLSETPDFLDTHPSPSGCENMKRYIGVTAILGITGASHPLISKQGFYILDGENRLFTMPYSLNADGSSKYCMWQLSFSGLTEGFLSYFRTDT